MKSNQARTHRLSQFSLVNLSLLCAIVALGVTVYQQHQTIGPLRDEVRRLRNESGQLSLEDASRLQAIQIETYNAWAWKWRIWIPAGKRYHLHWLVKDIPPNGAFLPTGAGILEAGEGREVVVSAFFERDPAGQIRLSIAQRGTIHHESLPIENQAWLLEGYHGSSGEGVSKKAQHVADNDEPFVLIRKRIFYDSSTGQIPPKPEPESTDGVLIWLEDQ